jgi:hypothetical protein
MGRVSRDGAFSNVWIPSHRRTSVPDTSRNGLALGPDPHVPPSEQDHVEDGPAEHHAIEQFTHERSIGTHVPREYMAQERST